MFNQLPAEGYSGPIPDFPLPDQSDREVEIWEWAWRTPQADAWAREPWRLMSVAMWVRTYAVCESLEAKAADRNALRSLANDIGMSVSGLRENGWTIAATPVAQPKVETPGDELAPRRRMRA